MDNEWKTTHSKILRRPIKKIKQYFSKRLLPIRYGIEGKHATRDHNIGRIPLLQAKNKIIIATYGVASVGINIPRIFNLVLIEPGKSFVRVIQSIGRGIRKAEDKDYLNVIDITSNLKYSKRHLTKRKAFYKEQGFPFQVTKLEYKWKY